MNFKTFEKLYGKNIAMANKVAIYRNVSMESLRKERLQEQYQQ